MIKYGILIFVALLSWAKGDELLNKPDGTREPVRRLKMLFPKVKCPRGVIAECVFADPSVPVAGRRGVRVTGSGFGYPLWNSWSAMLRGETYRWQTLNLFQRVGQNLMALSKDGLVWDITIENGRKNILYGGAVTPTQGRLSPKMGDDNWTRRVYAFTLDKQHRWVSEPLPITGMAPVDFLGHSYGHQFIDDENGERFVFYEKVSELNNDQSFPAKTEIFARKMETPLRASIREYKVLTVGEPPYPVTRRSADALIEGPRPFKAIINGQIFYFIGFSSGQYTTDTYGINLAVSKRLLGPYAVYLKPDRTDFFDLGAKIRNHYKLSWGPGRPAFFQSPDRRWWVLFHATESNDPENRHIFLAPVEITLGQTGIPEVTMGDNNPHGAKASKTPAALSRDLR